MRFALNVYLFLGKLHFFFHNTCIFYPGNTRLISLPTVCSLEISWFFFLFQFLKNCYEKKNRKKLIEHSIYKNEQKVKFLLSIVLS